MAYAKHLGNGVFDSRLYASAAQDRYPYVSTAESRAGCTCIAKGYKWHVDVESATGIYEYVAVEPGPTEIKKYSKLKLYAAIIALPPRNDASAWETLRTWLEDKTIDGINGWMAFSLAQEISNAHPLFASLSDEARVLLGLSQEQFDQLLSGCILDE